MNVMHECILTVDYFNDMKNNRTATGKY